MAVNVSRLQVVVLGIVVITVAGLITDTVSKFAPRDCPPTEQAK